MYGDYELQLLLKDLAKEIVEKGITDAQYTWLDGKLRDSSEDVMKLVNSKLNKAKDLEGALKALAGLTNIGGAKVINVNELLGKVTNSKSSRYY